MFTGIITHTGTVGKNDNNKLTISTQLAKELEVGDSISINGICLTVTKINEKIFEVEYVEETSKRTTIKSLLENMVINLELPARPDSFLSGHIVQGHIDTKAEVINIDKKESGVEITFEIDPDYTKYIVNKGSITLDGVSLTIAETEENNFKVAIIPHTLNATSLKSLKIGSLVNVEVDVIAKYIEKLNKEKK